MSTDRDLLAELIYDRVSFGEQVAEAVLSAGWRPPAQVIADPTASDTFPIRTVAVDRDGEVWVSGNAGWETIVNGGESLHDVVADFGPLTLVHLPTETGDTE